MSFKSSPVKGSVPDILVEKQITFVLQNTVQADIVWSLCI